MKKLIFILFVIVLLPSGGCSFFEKSSRHGFESGFYDYKTATGEKRKIFLDIGNDRITGHQINNHTVDPSPNLEISLEPADSLDDHPEIFGKQSIDIDISTILFKYRPGIQDLPAQLSTDFNTAMFVGWRRDYYFLKSYPHPFRHDHYEPVARGFDIGIFAGPGTTTVNPFNTKEKVINEYNGMILQYGIAGFIESNVASFGISAGYDYLLSPDRKFWIYHRQPWIGFIVGIALN
jgi:hypothetical protein